MDERVEANRRMWDERVPIHVASDFYALEDWKRTGRNHLMAPFELDEIGDVRGKRLCHLQCHIGMDTLTFARLGAQVVGVDFSAPAIEAARALAAELGIDATFVQSTVEDARRHVDGDFDIVYASWGWHVWLPDIDAWARTAASLLRPGGILWCADHHPVVRDSVWNLRYFERGPHVDHDHGTYADVTADTKENESWEWWRPLGDIVTAVAGAGLRVEHLHEHPVLPFQLVGEMVQGDDGMWRLPDDRLPVSFSLRARAS